ncbi:hypothetical protein GIB67_036710 [Kingdonia uniflora]|uniref:RING-type E3 ubiquitin transferase n=1 Tax=Kingdonia uniflora TaxID=39325 RepID=A0A7J7LWF2_9MAGN|nr:hypothetical protein GIB67_036710 [Kingdonia uniflora]
MSNNTSQHPNKIIPDIDSNDGKILVIAIITLLLVISFVLLLYAYTRWFFGIPHRRTRSLPITLHSNFGYGSTWLHNIGTTGYDDINMGNSEGVDASTIASLPFFVYKSEEWCKIGILECVICLSKFEDDEIGRHLPKCEHTFHIECIDMWLHSHSSCPICRAPVGSSKSISLEENSLPVVNVVEEEARQDLPAPVLIGSSTPVEHNSEVSLTPKYPPIPPSPSQCSSSDLSSSSLGSSIKRMLSRSRSEIKVFPSLSVVMSVDESDIV